MFCLLCKCLFRNELCGFIGFLVTLERGRLRIFKELISDLDLNFLG